ncbi:acyltransferase [Mucilaginibacter flavus]|nr:acyltransferase [Mucilaginibacter flavus]
MKKIHYPNLNFVRSLAALIVVFHHTEQLKSLHGLPNHWGYPPVVLVGKLSVDLFFSLSGFLITSLILAEKESFKRVDIKKFLMRRVLKIWPLYYLIFVIAILINFYIPALRLNSTFISPQGSFIENIFLYIAFLPHVQIYFIGPILYCAQAWSIGIEEYFYLFWPFVVNRLKFKGLMIFIIGFVIVYLIAVAGVKHLYITKYHTNVFWSELNDFMRDGLKFDCLLIGGFFAILNIKFDLKKYLTNKFFQAFLYVLEIFLVFYDVVPKMVMWEVHAGIYGLIIYNLVHPDTSIINMEYPIFNFLGKISYGIYMYHIVVVNVLIVLLNHFHAMYLLYPLVYIGVICLAWISFNYYEKYFLNLKTAYQKFATG